MSLSATSGVALPPVPEPLLALAPAHLPNFRKVRYQGDDHCITLAELDGRDQAIAGGLYQVLSELLSIIADTSADDGQKWADVTLWLHRHSLDRLIDEVREFGIASGERDSSEELAKATHDIRGGALSALLGRLQFFHRLPRVEEQLRTLFILTRDHLKIMRNAIVGLDEARRTADRRPKTHAMQLVLEKWHKSVVGPQWRERPIHMEMDCRYDGPLTECCLESAAIDRIFYNLAANAARHASGDRLDMLVFPVPKPPGECLRFVLSNAVDDADAAYLQRLAGSQALANSGSGGRRSLSILFEPQISTTGSGFGLTVVADFVTSAFGLRNRAIALEERYVGAVLDDRIFRAWFHWPIAHDGLPQLIDDYHRPQDSLGET